MRGKAAEIMAEHDAEGITPAYAGKSGNASSCIFIKGDHPRLCGEKVFYNFNDELDMGSPPPMRGKVHVGLTNRQLIGITPAYAGKRCRGSVPGSCTRDHPRLCGEKTKKIPKQRYFFHQPASFSFSLQYT